MTSRKTSMDAKFMKMSAHLIFDERGNMRLTRNQGGLKAGERSMELHVTVPRAIFRTPTLVGSITITEDGARDRIVAEVENNAAKVLTEHMGVDLNLTVKS